MGNVPGKAEAGIFFLLLLLQQSFAGSAVIYKNQGCGHCVPYIEGLVGMLEKNGYRDYVLKDYMSDSQARKEVAILQERFSVPVEMQGHLLVLLDDKYLFEGHVPAGLIEEYMGNPKGPVVVTQDKMDGATEYFMLMDGKAHECGIDEKISECLERNGAGSLAGAGDLGLGTVLGTGDWRLGTTESLLPFALLIVAGVSLAGAAVYSAKGQ